MSGSGISWAICKSAPSSRQITMPAPHHSVFTGQMPFLPPNQQRQSTEGTQLQILSYITVMQSLPTQHVCGFCMLQISLTVITTITTLVTHNEGVWESAAEDIEYNHDELGLWNVRKATMNVDLQTTDQLQHISEHNLNTHTRRSVNIRPHSLCKLIPHHRPTISQCILAGKFRCRQ